MRRSTNKNIQNTVKQQRKAKVVSFTPDDEILVHEIPRLSSSRYDDLFYNDDEIATFRYNAFMIMAGVLKEDENEERFDSSDDTAKEMALLDQSSSSIETTVSDLTVSTSSLPSYEEDVETSVTINIDNSKYQDFKQIDHDVDDDTVETVSTSSSESTRTIGDDKITRVKNTSHSLSHYIARTRSSRQKRLQERPQPSKKRSWKPSSNPASSSTSTSPWMKIKGVSSSTSADAYPKSRSRRSAVQLGQQAVVDDKNKTQKSKGTTLATKPARAAKLFPSSWKKVVPAQSTASHSSAKTLTRRLQSSALPEQPSNKSPSKTSSWKKIHPTSRSTTATSPSKPNNKILSAARKNEVRRAIPKIAAPARSTSSTAGTATTATKRTTRKPAWQLRMEWNSIRKSKTTHQGSSLLKQ